MTVLPVPVMVPPVVVHATAVFEVPEIVAVKVVCPSAGTLAEEGEMVTVTGVLGGGGGGAVTVTVAEPLAELSESLARMV